MIEYSETTSFKREFKKIKNKYPTLDYDFQTMKKSAIEIYHNKIAPTQAVVPIEGLCSDEYLSMKVRKFACRSLKGRGANSGIRIIYVYEKASQTVTFIEIYLKSDKANEDKKRIKDFLKKFNYKKDKGILRCLCL